VLSDPQRRSDYDRLSSSISSSARTSDPNASNTFFSMFSDMLTRTGGEGQSEAAPEQPVQRPNANIVFGTVFEDVWSSPFPYPYLPIFYTQRPLTSFFPLSLAASTARGRAALPVVDLARLSMRGWAGLYRRQRARPRRWRICGEPARGHSGCKGQERGCRVRRVGRSAESGGTLTAPSDCSP
jgi:hypothetical protein